MSSTTWETKLLELFDDLEQQASGLGLTERELEVAELSVTEYAQVGLADRLRASLGQELTLQLAGGSQVRGTLSRSGEEWLVLREARGSSGWLVPLGGVLALTGLSGRAAHASTASVADRLPLRALLRRAAEGAGPGATQVHLRDGSRRDGRIGRVGRDFLELAAGDQAALVLPLTAVTAVRWSAW